MHLSIFRFYWSLGCVYPFSSSRSGQLFKRDAEIRDRNAAKGGNGVVNGEIVDKTRSLLTGTESKAEERRRGQREKRQKEISDRTVRTVGQREKETKRKKGARTHTLATRWAGRDACVRSHTDGIPCFHAYTAIFSYSLPSCSSSSPRPLLFSLLLSKFRFHTFFHAFFVLFFPLFFFHVSIYLSCSFFFEIFIQRQKDEKKVKGESLYNFCKMIFSSLFQN